MENCHELLDGALKLIQPEEGGGLRVNVDTILLAHFVKPRAGEKILEIGCAHGAISLILARRGFSPAGIDIQPRLIELARKNAELNGLTADFSVADIREYKKLAPPQSFDRIVVNPPYDEAWSSRPSPREERSAAMHGSSCTLKDIIAASHYLLKNRGRLDLIMRGDRIGELFALLDGHKTPPKRMRCVHPRPGEKASVALIEAMRSGRHGLIIETPLFITDAAGKETPELKEAYIIREGR